MTEYRTDHQALALVISWVVTCAPMATGQTFVTDPAPFGPSPTLPHVRAVAGSPGHVLAAWVNIPPIGGVRAARTADWGGSWSPEFSASGSAFLSSSAAPGLAADASGHMMVAWNASGIHVAQSIDDGLNWTPPTMISGATGQPVIATDGVGTWILVWTSALNLGTTLDDDVLMARSSDDGQTWSVSHLNTDAASDGFDDSNARIASDGLGNWVAVWERSLPASARGLFVARSVDDGLSWLPPQLVTTVGMPFQSIEIAAGSNRWHVIVAVDYEIYVSRSDDAGSTWLPAHALTTTPGEDDLRPVIAADSFGTWSIVWQSRAVGTWAYRLLVSRSGDGGTSWSTPDPPLRPSYLVGTNETPSLITDRAGNWMLVWGRSLSGPSRQLTFGRGVGPCPTSSLTLTPSNPTPAGYLIDIAATGFTPGNEYFTCFTYEMGEHPSGPWFGIDPFYDELATQVGMLAPPFNGIFDAAGTSAYSWTLPGTPGPLGVTLYAVTIEHVTGNILRASPPFTATL